MCLLKTFLWDNYYYRTLYRISHCTVISVRDSPVQMQAIRNLDNVRTVYPFLLPALSTTSSFCRDQSDLIWETSHLESQSNCFMCKSADHCIMPLSFSFFMRRTSSFHGNVFKSSCIFEVYPKRITARENTGQVFCCDDSRWPFNSGIALPNQYALFFSLPVFLCLCLCPSLSLPPATHLQCIDQKQQDSTFLRWLMHK